MDTALALVREVASTAAGDAALWDFREAADFAGTVEELSRALDYLQLVAAGAVDRTRKQATTAPNANTAWTTGWRDDSAYGTPRPDNASGAVGAWAVSGSELPRVPRVAEMPRRHPDRKLPRVP